MLGGLSALAATAVERLPRRVAYPLAVGAWTNANAFGVLAFRPAAKDTAAYRAGVLASFATTTWGFSGLAAVAAKRARRRRRR